MKTKIIYPKLGIIDEIEETQNNTGEACETQASPNQNDTKKGVKNGY